MTQFQQGAGVRVLKFIQGAVEDLHDPALEQHLDAAPQLPQVFPTAGVGDPGLGGGLPRGGHQVRRSRHERQLVDGGHAQPHPPAHRALGQHPVSQPRRRALDQAHHVRLHHQTPLQIPHQRAHVVLEPVDSLDGHVITARQQPWPPHKQPAHLRGLHPRLLAQPAHAAPPDTGPPGAADPRGWKTT